MVKEPKKPNKTLTNTINSILPANKTTPKSRQQIYQENYQKNKEIKKAKRKERYANHKKQEQLSAQKYYQVSNIKVLLTLKEYTELNKEKHKLWLEFAWTLKDCQQVVSSIEEVMKLRESAENLIKDYRETAINESKKGQSWNSLSEKEQSKLIKYLSNEKLRKEQELNEKLTEWENQAKEYEKELEIAKFHEERGKIKCPCWKCAESRKLSEEINNELLKDNEEKQEQIKSECANCYEFKKVDKESGLCGKCSRE